MATNVESEIVGSTESASTSETESDSSKCSPCTCMSLDKHEEARGVNFNGIGRGAISMSNVYLSNSLILLACIQAGGADPNNMRCIDQSVRVYGFRPASLISNIYAGAGLVAAFLMPVIGAMIDFSPHRKKIGVIMAVLLALISGIQIGTVEDTWFAMAVLQALVLAVYQFELTVLYAYYPEIRRDVGFKKMVSYSGTWYFNQFCSQFSVNLFLIVTNIIFRFGTVKLAWLSQGVTTLFCLIFLPLCWKFMSSPPRKHEMPKGENILLVGFKQNWFMAKKIWKNYKSGLRWFLISTVFGEAGASAVGSTAVIFLSLHIGLTAGQIGVFFEVSLLGVILGTKLGAFVSRRTNPNISLQLSNLGLFVTVVVGCWLVEYSPFKELTYLWGLSIGTFLGWFYPCEALFLSGCIPVNVETEVAGFFNWCSVILSWLPPLGFTLVVENDKALPWALTVVAAFFVPAIFLLRMCGPWEEIEAEAKRKEMSFYESGQLNVAVADIEDGEEEPQPEQ